MNPESTSLSPRSAVRARRGFTLIELLVVIAIIVLLAGMIVPLATLASKKRNLARARAEIDNLCLAIDNYKVKKGFYPPDDTAPAGGTAGAFTNQLFYELWGMVLQTPVNKINPVFINTFSANEKINSNMVYKFFGASGIVNSSADTNEIINFIPRISAAEIQNIYTRLFYHSSRSRLGFCRSDERAFERPARAATGGYPPVNVIRYVSSNPTNNPTTYDLWVDVLIGGKTNRISNWSKDPQIVNY